MKTLSEIRNNAYEAPKCTIIVVESENLFCASATGEGVQEGEGSWGQS